MPASSESLSKLIRASFAVSTSRRSPRRSSSRCSQAVASNHPDAATPTAIVRPDKAASQLICTNAAPRIATPHTAKCTAGSRDQNDNPFLSNGITKILLALLQMTH
jgi:hypothetical protein